ncbi:MAG TPA: glycosyltransferase family 39 protein, partial [Spirochaetota bacterium]|nr:glycosyltransferase family 39 protein [Spirochaetota bacterium]
MTNPINRIRSIFNDENNRVYLFIIIFIAAFLTRLPTLFNDFYDVDELSAIVQTKEWLIGHIPGIDFKESKLPFYHAVFKLSYLISPSHGWVIVHLLTILMIFLTSICIYSLGKKVKGHTVGAVAAILYAVLISSFNRHFMATNGEVVYNLPVTAGALFFITALTDIRLIKRFIFLILTAISIYAAINVKFHGVILLVFIAVILALYYPFHKGVFRKIAKVYLVISIATILAILFDLAFTHMFANNYLLFVKNKLFYATEARSKSPAFFLAVFSYRQLTLLLWHFIIWVPGVILLYRLFRSRFKGINFALGSTAILFVLTFLMVFGGGARVYYHYFMAAYPSLCILAAFALCGSNGSLSKGIIPKTAKNAVIIALVPVTFFFAWNIKDVIIKHAAPDAFYNEGPALFWFRAIVVSSVNDYLLPNESYKATIKYIRKNTSPEDTIFVWGDGPQLYYFADRRIAVKHVWPKNAAIRINKFYKANTPESVAQAASIENEFIRFIEQRKPALVIDTSPKGLFLGVTKFGDFAQ